MTVRRSRHLNTTIILLILYATMYGAFGVASPFWPRFFELRGLHAQELGLLLGLGTLIRLISGPLIGRLADTSGRLRTVLAACLAFAAAFALSLLLAESFWSLLIVHMAQAAVLAPVTTTADALATSGARRSIQNGFEYGKIRGVASASFIIGTLTAGLMLSAHASSIVWMHATLLAVAAGAALLLPRRQALARPAISFASFMGGVRDLWTIALFRRVILVSSLIYGSHAVHDAFAVIRWNEAGVGPVMISVLWSEAVTAEVVVFVVIGPAFVNRLGTHGAAALAAVAGLLRWCVAGTTTSTIALAMIQPLHGFTFALLHLVCMRLIGIVVPERLAATAQALYALGSGIVSVVLTMLAGELYASWAGAAFLPMALLCAIALPLGWTGLRQPAARAS